MKIKAKSKHHIVAAVLNFDSGEVEIHQIDLNADDYESTGDEGKVEEYINQMDCFPSSGYYMTAHRRGASLNITVL